jgi:hypothetical protein
VGQEAFHGNEKASSPQTPEQGASQSSGGFSVDPVDEAVRTCFRDQPRIVTAAQKARGKVARAQIAVTQATFSNAGASRRIFLTNAI